MDSKNNKILFVDDEQKILDSIMRGLFESPYEIETALGPVEAVKKIKMHGPYAVIVSDQQMPVMDGITFFARVKELYPDTVRIMLTGNADLNKAIDAVNLGSVFQFLRKPCDIAMLSSVLDAAIKQYHLVVGERELLEKTLNKTISMLVDILAFSNPLAAKRAKRMSYIVGQIVEQFPLPDPWRFKIAALLSQLGFVTMPKTVLTKIYSNDKLASIESEMLKAYPKIGADLIADIPRLEEVSAMIRNHQQNCNMEKKDVPLSERDVIEVGAELLTLAGHFDTCLAMSGSLNEALYRLEKKSVYYNPQMIAALQNVDLRPVKRTVAMIAISHLEEGMLLEKDVTTTDGWILAEKGQEISPASKVRFENYWRQGKLSDAILVSHPMSE